MAQYCDSQVLEKNWYNWILSNSVPELEKYRSIGVLWTRVVGHAQLDGQDILVHGRPLPDPSYPIRKHCLALKTPFFFETHEGKPTELIVSTGSSLLDPPTYRLEHVENVLARPLDVVKSDKVEHGQLLDDLVALGYERDIPTDISWHAMLEDIRKICNGIVTKFRMRSEEEQADLASDALLQITNKLVTGRLVYMPGRAPVFNLLTTTTYRIIYSILNKKNSQKESIRKFIDDAAAGVLPKAGRSIRVPHAPSHRR